MKARLHDDTADSLISANSPIYLVDEELMTVEEVAHFLKVPESWVYERTRRRGVGRLPHYKIGKYLRFLEREIVEWLQQIRGI
jgi:excisionase family DNA binding protein